MSTRNAGTFVPANRAQPGAARTRAGSVCFGAEAATTAVKAAMTTAAGRHREAIRTRGRYAVGKLPATQNGFTVRPGGESGDTSLVSQANLPLTPLAGTMQSELRRSAAFMPLHHKQV